MEPNSLSEKQSYVCTSWFLPVREHTLGHIEDSEVLR